MNVCTPVSASKVEWFIEQGGERPWMLVASNDEGPIFSAYALTDEQLITLLKAFGVNGLTAQQSGVRYTATL